MDGLTIFGVITNILQFFDFIIRLILLLLGRFSKRVAIEKVHPKKPSRTLMPLDHNVEDISSPDSKELLAALNYFIHSIPCLLPEKSVFFIDFSGTGHLVPLHMCGTVEVSPTPDFQGLYTKISIKAFITFILFTYKACQHEDIKARITRGEFWLVPRGQESILGSRHMIEQWPSVLADNYEMNVRAGALFLMKTDASLAQEALRTLKEAWKLIPRNRLEVLFSIAGWEHQNGLALET